MGCDTAMNFISKLTNEEIESQVELANRWLDQHGRDKKPLPTPFNPAALVIARENLRRDSIKLFLARVEEELKRRHETTPS